MMKKIVKYNYGGDLGSLSMVLSQLLSTQNSRVQDENNSGLGVATSALSEGLQGFTAGSSFGPVGSIAGGVLGLGKGLIDALKAKKEAEEQRKLQKQQEMLIEQDRSAEIMRNYPTKGLGVKGYYNYGGDMGDAKPIAISGGYLKKLNSNGIKVVGDTHEEDSNKDGNTGVILMNKGMKAEVEGGEVIYKGKVFSNSMAVPGTNKTFADLAKELLESNKFESEEMVRTQADTDSKKGKTYLQRNKGFRNAQKVSENPMIELFNTQEQMKQAAQQEAEAMMQQQMPKGKFGLDLNKVSPFVDNITNLLLTNRSVQVPDPVLTQAPKLRTQYDNSGMIANVNNSEQNYGNVITGNTSGSSVLAARLGQLRGQSIGMKNQLTTDKVNQENALVNQSLQAEYQNRVANTSLINQNKLMQMQQKDDIATRVSANAANLTEDLRMGERDKNMAIRDRQTMLIELTKYADTGVLERSNIIQAMQDLEAGIPFETVLQKYKKTGITSNSGYSTNTPQTDPTNGLSGILSKYLPKVM